MKVKNWADPFGFKPKTLCGLVFMWALGVSGIAVLITFAAWAPWEVSVAALAGVLSGSLVYWLVSWLQQSGRAINYPLYNFFHKIKTRVCVRIDWV